MRLTTVLLIASMLQVSASGFGQRLNYVHKQATLLELFKEIKVQTGYNVVWPEQDVNVDATIRANFKNTLIMDVMSQSLKGLNLTYVINKKTIIIKSESPTILDKTKSIIQRIFQDINVRGYVVDDQNSPLRGATVKIKGSNRLTTTNEQGAFSLANVPELSILVITYLGYQTQEIKASADMGVVKLVLNTDKLDEVEINAGYYTVKDRERTGSISRITAKDIKKQPINNPLMALQGRVAGLQVTQTTGVPGGGFIVQIRGRNSINSGNEPLYVVDGVIFPASGISGLVTSTILRTGGASPLSLLSPNDIESIEVLKDADATAIFGSRGANGVILITTKKGSGEASRLNVSFSQGFSEVANRLKLLNTGQYVEMRREALRNDVISPSGTDFDINNQWDQIRYTDWQDVLIGGKALITSASLDVKGGNKSSNYLVAGNYYREGTVFPGDFGLGRAGIRSNVNMSSPNERLTGSVNLTYNYSKSKLLASNLASYILYPPNAPSPYDEFGKLNWSENTVTNNPMALLLETSDANTYNLIGNFSLNYRIVRNLFIKTTIGYSLIKRDELQKYPMGSYAPSNIYARRISHFGDHQLNTLLAEPMVTYNITILGGRVDALAGLNLQSSQSHISVIGAADFNSDDIMEDIGSAALLTKNQNDFNHYRYMAGYARLNYSKENRYFINLTARRDGSSRFGPGKQFANFWAAGSAWIFSEEKFFKGLLPFVSFGKLRASYGTTGNDQIPNYGYLQLYNANSFGTFQGVTTLNPGNSPANADFAWEVTDKLEAELQLGFLSDGLRFEIAWYRNTTSNQLMYSSLPPSSGLSGLYANTAARVQNTGLELEVKLNFIKKAHIQWSAGVNLTIPRNKLLSYPGLETSTVAMDYKVGEPLTIRKVFNVSVDQQKGIYTFEDKNGNGARDDADRYLTAFLGQYYYGGISNSFRIKNFNLDFQISFTKQNGDRYLAFTTQNPGRRTSGSSGNQPLEVLSRWQNAGDQSTIQKYSASSANNSLNTAARNFGNISVVDASYMRLRNMAISYSLPAKFSGLVKISHASITVLGQNLFTMTDYIGLDPEVQGLNVPPLRTLSIGLNLTL